ncbi:phage tail protein [Janthinobacterium sp.]|uniref:phage tail protein n=1 Tax=Janthinobacterium sp. TaxID=1871054 RepID=UPI002582EB14|nr:phage tail protein [Janthinobacterium sp.]MCX7290798.1 phage tail protein [Janthinobacterium sp.]
MQSRTQPCTAMLDPPCSMASSEHGIIFEVGFNHLETVDISIKLNLSERAAVKAGATGRLDIKHLADLLRLLQNLTGHTQSPPGQPAAGSPDAAVMALPAFIQHRPSHHVPRAHSKTPY